MPDTPSHRGNCGQFCAWHVSSSVWPFDGRKYKYYDMSKRPKTAWCAAINRSGLLFSTPFKGTWHSDIGGYWDEIGNDDAADLGQVGSAADGRITFASSERAQVDAWLSGASAAIGMINSWSEAPPSYDDYVRYFDGEEV